MATIIDAVEWPDELNREGSLVWEPVFGNEYSPPTLDGTIQVRNGNGGGLWRASFNKITLWTNAELLLWQKMEVLLAGGLEPVNVPVLMCKQFPTPASGDNADIEVTVVGTTLARSTTLVVDLVESGELVAGMHFSRYGGTYGHRMYRISDVAEVIGEPTQRSLTIWPPLRAGLVNAMTIRFNNPLCVMKLAAPDVMRSELELRVRGAPSISFVEAF